MEWQAIVMVMQILMLAVGWFLFQQARGELSARAAETPVLGEVKALQKSIKRLLLDLVGTSDRTSAELETRCKSARELIGLLDARFAELEALEQSLGSCRGMDRRDARENEWPPLTVVTELSHSSTLAFREPNAVPISVSDLSLPGVGIAAAISADTRAISKDRIFELADAGHSASAIARETGISEGEIETRLGLRLQRA